MAMRFADKVVLVTGASSGVGRAVARRVAAEGAAVVLGARGVAAGERLAAEIRAEGGTAVFVPTDVTVATDMERLTGTAMGRFGRLDAAFNNAGGVTAAGSVHELTPGQWEADLGLNLTSVFHGLRHQVPVIAASGGGAILNNASNLGVVGMATVAPYVAAKHGVVGLTRAVALEGAERGVRVNAVLSGAIDTPGFRTSMGATPEGEAHVAGLHPLGRIGTAEEIAAFCAFLLSDESSFVTGAALSIDGGYTTR